MKSIFDLINKNMKENDKMEICMEEGNLLGRVVSLQKGCDNRENKSDELTNLNLPNY